MTYGTNRRDLAGFTLIEVLIALVVLSIGMLGIASLYTQALGASRSTQFRGQAINLLADMADRIRINRLGQASYAGAAADNGCDPAGGANCTPDQMAAHDLFLWDTQVQTLLPGGEWEINFDNATAPPTYTLTVRWEEVGEGQVAASFDVQVPNI
jgi:type IV pilus assembly protein PilV